MSNKLLSIIIPVYNMEKYIGRCLDTCLNQNIDASLYEIICINDGSKDRTFDILNEYAEKYPNIRVKHMENGGVVKARNTGLSLAEGQYVWFVDSDDWIVKNSLSYLANVAENGDCDLILFREQRVKDFCSTQVDLSQYEPTYADNGYMIFDDHYTTGSGFYWFKRSIMTEHNIIFRPDVYYSDDTLFIAKFKPWVKRMAITEAPIYYYLQREDSVSHAVKVNLHCACMYKLAKEYTALSKETFPNYGGIDIASKMKNARIRAMQAVTVDLCLSCTDKSFVKQLLQRANREGLYPYGVDWKQLRIDRRQSRKNDLLNWVFAFTSCRLYFWLCYHMCGNIRKKRTGQAPFRVEDFDDYT